jgi:hypothetical protein
VVRWTRVLFGVAALWNAQALACLVAAGPVQELLLGERLAGGGAILWTDLWVFVVIMGIGSALVAVDPERNRGIALVAALGKTAAAVHWLALVAAGAAPALLAAGAVGDLALGVAMGAWWWAGR